MGRFVSRAGQKLEHAITHFGVDPKDKICADLGCSTGGFVDCLLQHDAAKVFAIDTGYGVLDWKLRNHPRVVVMERTNAMHVRLPQLVDLITIDAGWTQQRHILPSAHRLLGDRGLVISLIKPHYEADPAQLRKGVLPESQLDSVLTQVHADIEACGFKIDGAVRSPITGSGGNIEELVLLGKTPNVQTS